jgi:ectoine hydroxylase-related dioxygenase (phytanoyl-CoA dioxygenase family)
MNTFDSATWSYKNNMQTAFTEQHKHDFEKNGVCILHNVLSQDEVRYVRDKVMLLAQHEVNLNAAHYYTGDGTAQRVWNLINKDECFRDIIQRPVILDAMDWLFDRDTPHQKYYLSSFQAHLLHPGAKRMKLHIDTPVPEPLPEWIIKANTIWVLDEFTENNGSTEYLPGSHKFKHKPTLNDQSRNDLTIACAPVGSVLITHGALWHRGGENNSNITRVGLLGSFAASYAREIANEENYSVVLDQQILERASDNFRKILGPEHGIRPGSQTSPPK